MHAVCKNPSVSWSLLGHPFSCLAVTVATQQINSLSLVAGYMQVHVPVIGLLTFHQVKCIAPGRYQSQDLFIKVLWILCPNLTDAFFHFSPSTSRPSHHAHLSPEVKGILTGRQWNVDYLRLVWI